MDNLLHPLPNEIGEPLHIETFGPAAGTNYDQLMPNNYIYRLIGVHYKIVTDGTVMNRYPGISISDSTGHYFQIIPQTGIPASRTVYVNLMAGMLSVGTLAGDYYIGSVPSHLYLCSLDTVHSAVIQIQAADQLSEIYMKVERWPYKSV